MRILRDMARWRILDGPNRLNDPAPDGVVFSVVVENVNDPAQRRVVRILIVRTVLSSDPATLPREIVDAVESQGRTAVERFLDGQMPERIVVSTTGILEDRA